MALKLWNVLCADMYRYRGKASARDLVAAYLHEPGFRFTYYLRKVKFYSPRKKTFGIFAYIYNRLMLHHYRMRYGFDISPATSIGPGLYIGHFGGVVVSPHATLGANVNIAQGVTIGSTSSGPQQGAPTIGDKVWIGANAVVVGKITIGSQALIGPGAYVYFDVPANGVVLGNPGIIVGHSGSQRYVNRILEEDSHRDSK